MASDYCAVSPVFRPAFLVVFIDKKMSGRQRTVGSEEMRKKMDRAAGDPGRVLAQPVADAPYRLNKIRAKFFAQLTDVDIHGIAFYG